MTNARFLPDKEKIKYMYLLQNWQGVVTPT